MKTRIEIFVVENDLFHLNFHVFHLNFASVSLELQKV